MPMLRRLLKRWQSDWLLFAVCTMLKQFSRLDDSREITASKHEARVKRPAKQYNQTAFHPNKDWWPCRD